MNTAYDSCCCLADQLFYYQVLFARSRDPRIEMAVRRVNDAPFLVGEKPVRMLGCWHFDGEKVRGPSPWWAEEWAHSKSPEARSLLNMAVRHARHPRGPGPMRLLQDLLKSLVE